MLDPGNFRGNSRELLLGRQLAEINDNKYWMQMHPVGFAGPAYRGGFGCKI